MIQTLLDDGANLRLGKMASAEAGIKPLLQLLAETVVVFFPVFVGPWLRMKLQPYLSFFGPLLQFLLGQGVSEPEGDEVDSVFLSPVRKAAVRAMGFGFGTVGFEDRCSSQSCLCSLGNRRSRQDCLLHLGFQAGNERLVHHVVDDFARGVERAGLFAGGRAGFRVIGREEIFKHLAGQFRVERHFLLDRRVFLDREMVALKMSISPRTRHSFEFLVAVIRAQIHFALPAEEKKIRHDGLAVFAAGEAVNADVARLRVFAEVFVETLEQSAV